jgi:translation initiation factor IF-1
VSKNDFIELEGVVQEVRPNATFNVVTDQGHNLLAHLSGKMRQNRIQVLLGDRVKLEVSPYDVTKGRIIYRSK